MPLSHTTQGRSSVLSRYSVALAVVAVALGLRQLLDPMLGDHLTLLTLYGGVAFAVWFGGWGPATVAALTGYLAADYLFIPPRGAFEFDAVGLTGFIGYSLSCGVIIYLGEAVRRARESAEQENIERRRAEEALLQRGAELETIINSTPFLLTRCGRDLRYRFVSRGYAELCGRSAGDIIGKPIVEIIGEEGLRTILPHVEAVLAGNRTEYQRDIHFAITGTRSIHAIYTADKDSEGNVIGWISSVLDVTERKRAEASRRESEERLSAFFNSAAIGAAFLTPTGTFVQVNEAFCQIVGYSREELARMDSSMLTHEDDARKTARLRSALLSGDTRSFAIELRFIRNDGIHVWVRKDVSVMRDATGQALQLVMLCQDVTERRHAEEAMRDAGKRKDEFLAMLGHELRNPLSAIRHAVQFAKEAPDDAASREWSVEVIDRQSQQLSRMVDDLLDVARINCGRIELRPENLDLREVLARTIATARPLMENKNHTFIIEMTDEPLPARGDAGRLEQVFVNLLDNAAKYTPGGGRIRLTTQRKNGDVVVSIADNGVGITPDLLPHVFDLFRQGDTSEDRSQGGLGIGLTVVKSLIDMHGGRVVVESSGARAGTTFTVLLPLVTGLTNADEAGAPQEQSAALSKATRILVVDDHVDTATALRQLLVRRNCEVRVAHDGLECISIAHEFRPEVLLLDLGLPGLSGYEIARALRADPTFSDALFIAISGYALDSDRERSLVAGFDLHCAKPVDFATLMSVIRSKSAGNLNRADQQSSPEDVSIVIAAATP